MAENLAILGLVFDIAGVVLLFCYSPEKFPDPQWDAFFAVEGESKKRRERWKDLQPRRERITRVSVILIILGFVLQLLGEVVAASWFNL